MILVVDMNSTENPLGFYEFVLPIVSIAEELEKCDVKHYLEVNEKSLNRYDKIILSGSALKNTVTLEQTARFTWLKDCGKPVLGICAGMQTTGLVFGGRMEKCREIGMTEIATSKATSCFLQRSRCTRCIITLLCLPLNLRCWLNPQIVFTR